MKFLITILLAFPLLLSASFFEAEDPALYHHVNVITGQLNLSFVDAVVRGPTPLPIRRTYSSAGAFERNRADSDLKIADLRSSFWMFQGGWSLMPHTQLLVQRNYECSCKGTSTVRADVPEVQDFCYILYLQDKTGEHVIYKCSNETRHKFTPKKENHRASGNVNARGDLQYSFFEIESRKAVLSLPDGGKRYYIEKDPCKSLESFWTLDLEVLPNKHRIAYFYNSDKLSRIELQNPSGNKAFATVHFNEEEKKLSANVLGTTLSYEMMEHEKRKYLQKVSNQFRDTEELHYEPARKSLGARINSVKFEGKDKFIAEYYGPESKRRERKLTNPYKKKPIELDKVQTLRLPRPEDGTQVDFAKFSYDEKYTDVRDIEGVVTRYAWYLYNLE